MPFARREPGPDISGLLVAWKAGDRAALEALAPLVHHELRRLARRYLAGESPGHVLQPTALVNEVWIRLLERSGIDWQNRAHFFGLAATIMRRVLVDLARARRRAKRGGSAVHVSLSDAEAIAPARGPDLIALDAALEALEALAPRQVRVVELRFFGGLSLEEIAEALDVSVGTVRRDWSLAEAFLCRELTPRASR